MRTLFLPKAALQQRKTALQHWKSCVAGKWRFPATLSCGFQAHTFRPPHLGPADDLGRLEAHIKSPDLRLAPPHTGSRSFGPGTQEESEKSPERVLRARAPKVPKECAPESQKSPKSVRKSGFRLFRTLLRLRARSFGTFGALAQGTLFGLFPDSSGFPGPKSPAAIEVTVRAEIITEVISGPKKTMTARDV